MPWPPFSWWTALTMSGWRRCQASALAGVSSLAEPSSTITIWTSSAYAEPSRIDSMQWSI